MAEFFAKCGMEKYIVLIAVKFITAKYHKGICVSRNDTRVRLCIMKLTGADR